MHEAKPNMQIVSVTMISIRPNHFPGKKVNPFAALWDASSGKAPHSALPRGKEWS